MQEQKMCLYQKMVKNPKYLPSRKNNYNPPKCNDERLKYVPTDCGVCIECRRKKAREWQARLTSEMKQSTGKFITLTFSPESIELLKNKYNIEECNALATKAVRMFLERYRKKYKKSIKHWLITELGQKESERIHLHGILLNENNIKNNEELEKLWTYGKTDIGQYCNNQTINYIIKYITKSDLKHKQYRPIILCSAGIGKGYLNSYNATKNKYTGQQTDCTYILPNGRKINLPQYYKRKLYTDEQREQIWKNVLDENKFYILGNKYEKDSEDYQKALKGAKILNERLNYGDNSEEWKKKPWNITEKMLKKGVKQKKREKMRITTVARENDITYICNVKQINQLSTP